MVCWDNGKGQVMFDGELWQARGNDKVVIGGTVIIERIEGLTVTVSSTRRELEI